MGIVCNYFSKVYFFEKPQPNSYTIFSLLLSNETFLSTWIIIKKGFIETMFC